MTEDPHDSRPIPLSRRKRRRCAPRRRGAQRRPRATGAGGFRTRQLRGVEGDADVGRIDVEGKAHGLAGTVKRWLQGVLSDDANHARRYAEHLRKGHFILGVSVGEDEAAKQRAADALRASGRAVHPLLRRQLRRGPGRQRLSQTAVRLHARPPHAPCAASDVLSEIDERSLSVVRHWSFSTIGYLPRRARRARSPRPRTRVAGHNPDAMTDVSHAAIEQLNAIDFLEGFTFRRAGAELGVTPFGMSIIDMPPETTAYPAHDHSSKGTRQPAGSPARAGGGLHRAARIGRRGG